MKKNLMIRLLAVMLCLITCCMIASCDLVDQYFGKDSEETTAAQTTEAADTAESQPVDSDQTTDSSEPAVADKIVHGDAMGDDDFMTVVWGDTQE